MIEEEKEKKRVETEKEEEVKPMISINMNQEAHENEEKNDSESFENFMKRRMSETSLNNRKKSRTPSKLKSTKEKINKWGDEGRKSVSETKLDQENVERKQKENEK